MISRRQLLTAAFAGLTIPFTTNSWATPSPTLLLSACDNQHGEHFACGINLDAEVQWQIPLPERAHALAAHPQQPWAVVFARRPGTFMYCIDYQRGVVLHEVESLATRHFYGHGCFSHDGSYLYCTENDFEAGQGVIGVYALPEFKKVGEFPSYGIGPHELRLHPQQAQLIVANGGIQTHPDMPRRQLNVETMSPSLVYIDAVTGALQQQLTLPEAQSSIRHLAVSATGQVGLALQHQNQDHVPLVAFQHGKQVIQYVHAPEKVWAAMHHYTASITFASQHPIVAVTCPRGQTVSFWHTQTRDYLGQIELADAGGLVYDPVQQVFWVSTGQGEWVEIGLPELAVRRRLTLAEMRWDNHAILVG